MTKIKYNPEVNEIWWFGPDKKHYLILSKEVDPNAFGNYKWIYKIYCLETGYRSTIHHGNMNAHGEGWFRKVSG